MSDGHAHLEQDTCRHCGTPHARRLGVCSVCGLSVCERCGNTQFSHGERTARHDSCLAKDDGGFTMIKFVK